MYRSRMGSHLINQRPLSRTCRHVENSRCPIQQIGSNCRWQDDVNFLLMLKITSLRRICNIYSINWLWIICYDVAMSRRGYDILGLFSKCVVWIFRFSIYFGHIDIQGNTRRWMWQYNNWCKGVPLYSIFYKIENVNINKQTVLDCELFLN